jgi:hypothetical protein
MALEKFIPLSPDPYITKDSDMKLAQFGHLNTIVDYLNGILNISKYNIIITKLNQTNPVTFPIQKQDTVSIGTNYTPTANPLQTGDGNTFVGINTAMGDDNSYFNTMIGYAASITAVEPKNVVIGAQATSGSAEVVAIGHLASSSAVAGIAIGAQASVTGSQGVAIGRAARTTTAFGFALGNASALLQIGGNFVPTARVHIKGTGSTVATTSLLVQNSSSSTALEVKDDLTANFQGRIQIEYDKISFLGSPSNTYIQQALGIGFGYYSAAVSNQIMINAQPKIIVKDTGSSRASTLIVGHSVPTTDAADVSALLEVRSDALYLKGFLKPRMTTTQKNAIVTPAAGLEVFDTTLGRPCFYSGSAWVTL